MAPTPVTLTALPVPVGQGDDRRGRVRCGFGPERARSDRMPLSRQRSGTTSGARYAKSDIVGMPSGWMSHGWAHAECRPGEVATATRDGSFSDGRGRCRRKGNDAEVPPLLGDDGDGSSGIGGQRPSSQWPGLEAGEPRDVGVTGGSYDGDVSEALDVRSPSQPRTVGMVWEGLVRSVQVLSATVSDLPVELRRPTVDAAVAIVEEVGFAAGWLVRQALVPAAVHVAPGSGIAGATSASDVERSGATAGIRVVQVPPEQASDVWESGAGPAVGAEGERPGAAVTDVPAVLLDELRHAVGPGPEGIGELAALATRLVEEARLRRHTAAETVRPVDVVPEPVGAEPGPAPGAGHSPGAGPSHPVGPSPGDDRGPGAGHSPGAGSGPGIGAGPAVGFGSEPAPVVGPQAGGRAGFPSPETGAADTPASSPSALALAAVADAAAESARHGRTVVGFADVVGVADPGTATRILQSRVLGALVPGDVPFMVGPGQVVFILRDADLVEADRRFRHITASRTASAPVVRLGFAVPRTGDDAAAVMARAAGAATSRWGRRAMVRG